MRELACDSITEYWFLFKLVIVFVVYRRTYVLHSSISMRNFHRLLIDYRDGYRCNEQTSQVLVYNIA